MVVAMTATHTNNTINDSLSAHRVRLLLAVPCFEFEIKVVGEFRIKDIKSVCYSLIELERPAQGIRHLVLLGFR
jgi:hypothetical protein